MYVMTVRSYPIQSHMHISSFTSYRQTPILLAAGEGTSSSVGQLSQGRGLP